MYPIALFASAGWLETMLLLWINPSAVAAVPGAMAALLVRSSFDVASIVSPVIRKIDGVNANVDGVICATPPDVIASAAMFRVLVVIVVFPAKFALPLVLT